VEGRRTWGGGGGAPVCPPSWGCVIWQRLVVPVVGADRDRGAGRGAGPRVRVIDRPRREARAGARRTGGGVRCEARGSVPRRSGRGRGLGRLAFLGPIACGQSRRGPSPEGAVQKGHGRTARRAPPSTWPTSRRARGLRRVAGITADASIRSDGRCGGPTGPTGPSCGRG
jgi:hypothetical protein